MCGNCKHYEQLTVIQQEQAVDDRLPCEDSSTPPGYSAMTMGIRHNLRKSHHHYNDPEIELVDVRDKPIGFIGSTEFVVYNLSAYKLHSSIANPTKELKYVTGIAWLGAKEGDIGYDILGRPVILGVGSPAFYIDKYGQSELEPIYRYRCSNCKRLYVSLSHKKCDCPLKSTPPEYATK